jgi:autotransporter-associated beta strand protein
VSTNPNTLNGTITLSNGTVAVSVETNGVGMVLGGQVTGAGGLNKTSFGALELRGTNTYSGNTTITDGVLKLAQNARLTFTIGGNGTNNAVGGTGTFTNDGVFVFNLSGASTTTGDSWTIVAPTVTNSYGTNFLVNGFSGSGGNWTNTTNGATYVFAQSTGVLTVQSGGTNAYDSWVSFWQGSYPGFTNTAPAADPDGDGFDNSEEFAFDGNPAVGSPALLRAAKGGTNSVISWVARNTGVTYSVNATTNLAAGPWTNAAVTVTDSPDQTGIVLTNDYTRKQFTVPAAGNSFFEVEAITP